MHKKLIEFNVAHRNKVVPELKSGDVVKVYRKIIEGGKERTQVFQGMVIALRGGQSSSPMVTVRKVSFGIGVEIVFPLYSPNIEKIEVIKRTRARRAKLFYVRSKPAKLLGKKLKEVASEVTMLGEKEVVEVPELVSKVSESKEDAVSATKVVETSETPEENQKA